MLKAGAPCYVSALRCHLFSLQIYERTTTLSSIKGIVRELLIIIRFELFIILLILIHHKVPKRKKIASCDDFTFVKLSLVRKHQYILRWKIRAISSWNICRTSIAEASSSWSIAINIYQFFLQRSIDYKILQSVFVDSFSFWIIKDLTHFSHSHLISWFIYSCTDFVIPWHFDSLSYRSWFII